MQIANLTFARFVAAFLVFLHHSPQLQTYSSGILGNRSSTFMANGFVGVTFFFILSGFVLSHMYFASFHDIRFSNTASFYAHRLARIVPLWLFLSLPLIALSIYQGTYDRNL